MYDVAFYLIEPESGSGVVTWCCLKFDNGVQAHEPSMSIMRAFLDMALTKAKTGVMLTDEAIFSESNPEDERITVYFTPSTNILAKQFGAIPCKKPIPIALQFSLLAGDQFAWKAHFPDYLDQRTSEY